MTTCLCQRVGGTTKYRLNWFLLDRHPQAGPGGAQFFGVKDPRLCRLMPLWFPIFETLPAEPNFVLTVRHPWEVAESLARRNGLKPSKSFLLWLDHTLQAEAATADIAGFCRVR